MSKRIDAIKRSEKAESGALWLDLLEEISEELAARTDSSAMQSVGADLKEGIEKVRAAADEGDGYAVAQYMAQVQNTFWKAALLDGASEIDAERIDDLLEFRPAVRSGLGALRGLAKAQSRGTAGRGPENGEVSPQQRSEEYAQALDKAMSKNPRKSYTQATTEIAEACGIGGPAVRKHLRKYPTEKYPPRKISNRL